jgi:hypothetical protein
MTLFFRQSFARSQMIYLYPDKQSLHGNLLLLCCTLAITKVCAPSSSLFILSARLSRLFPHYNSQLQPPLRQWLHQIQLRLNSTLRQSRKEFLYFEIAQTDWTSYALSEGIVTIEIGADRKKYCVHKELLTHHSAYFRKALQGPWEEARSGVITLEDVEPAVCKCLPGSTKSRPRAFSECCHIVAYDETNSN